MTGSLFSGEIEANRFTVKKILDLARGGDLRIPAFQRPLRWRRSDHLLFLDSLYRGYPVGTLLLWRRSAPRATVLFGGFSTEADARAGALWIVDGQQRITSLVGCLLFPGDLSRRRTSEFAFYFDLDHDRFVAATDQPRGHIVPVNRLADPVDTSMWARETEVSPDLHRKAEEVGARLRNYEIPAYVTHAESDAMLRTIFARTNTAGKRMRQEEVFEALNKGFHPSATPQGLTERLRGVLHALDFGTLGDDVLQKALVCVAGFNPRETLPAGLNDPGVATAWEAATVEGLRRTVDFLRESARIPHARVLPYTLPVILLPRFFHLYPDPHERSVELLVRWVWRGIAGQTHMATNQQFNPHHKALKAGSEEAVVQAMLRLVGKTRPQMLPRSALYNPRGMKTRLELCALYDRGPRHISTGAVLSAKDVFEPDTPEPGLFPDLQPQPPAASPDLPMLPIHIRGQRRQVASCFLHPNTHGGMAFVDQLRRASDAVLASHGILSEAVNAVRQGAWTEVLESRERELRRSVSGLIERQARWNEDDDGPSLDALLADCQEPQP